MIGSQSTPDPWGAHLRFALTDPVKAVKELTQTFEAETDDREAALLAQALGVALRTIGRPDDSRSVVERGVNHAIASGEPALVGDLKLTLSGSLATMGDVEAAREMAEQAKDAYPEELDARADVQIAAFEARSGSFDDALALLDRAEGSLRASGDVGWLARLYNSRALIRVYAGDPGGAESDLERTFDIEHRAGLTASAAETLHNLGWVKSRQGDLVEALRLYDEAAEILRSLDYPLNELLTDRAETLLAARLTIEALAQAADAVETVDAAAAPIDLPEAWLMYAQAASVAGKEQAAHDAAVEAQKGFRAIEATGWQSLADLMVATSELDGGADSVKDAVAGAGSSGWRIQAYQGGLEAARRLAVRGQHAGAAAVLAMCDATLESKALPSVLRAQRLGTGASVHASSGDWSSAVADASEALDVLADYRASIAATDLRASTSALAVDTMHVLVDLLGEAERYEDIVRAVDRGRASMTNPPPVNPPGDSKAVELVTDLRDLVAEAQTQSDDAAAVVQSIRSSEESYQRVASSTAALADPFSLGERGVVVASGSDSTYSLAVEDGRTTCLSSVQKDAVLDALDAVLTSLPHGSERWDAARAAVGRLDDLLFAGADLTGVRVLSPPAWMMTVPWSLLPSVPSSVVVAPRPSTFAVRDGAISEAASVLVASGPDLVTADAEASAIAGLYRESSSLTGSAATVSDTIEALGTVDVAHVAAHGVFRSDNPLFSNLRLSDGALHVHDLERLHRVPETVVLSACDSGAVASTGLDLTGFVSVLLSIGVRTVIAAVTPVPDSEATSRLITELHTGLVSGLRPSDALGSARNKLGDDPLEQLSAHTFQCLGWG